MPKKHGFFQKLGIDITVGIFLAKRELKRANKWTTSLIVFVMLLTFLNLVVVSGILVGLIQGSVDAQRGRHSSDMIVTVLTKKTYIEQSQSLITLSAVTLALTLGKLLAKRRCVLQRFYMKISYPLQF